MGKSKAAKLTREAKEFFRQKGSKGGQSFKLKVSRMSDKDRKAIGKRLAAARAAKLEKRKKGD